MKSFKTWLEDTHDEPERDYSPDELYDDGSHGSHKFEVDEIGYVDNRPAIPGLPSQGEDKEVHHVTYDIDFTMTKGMKGDYSKADFGVQMTPDDDDEYNLTDVEVEEVNHKKFNENHPILKTLNITLNKLEEILVKYFNDYLHEEALEQAEDHHRH